jgi:hypothetical protein
LLSAPLIYRIDTADRLCFVNEVWKDSAQESHTESVKSENILGKLLWECVSDPGVRSLYVQMIEHARAGRPVGFKYRCDTPSLRRTYAMTIDRQPGGGVEFASVLVRQESRAAVAILESGHARDPDRFVRVCSWCQSVALPSGEWVPVEEAVNKLDLMGDDQMPRLTHGICEGCAKAMWDKLGLLE